MALTGQNKFITYRLIILFTLMNLGFYSFSTVFINFLKADLSTGGLGLDKTGQLPFHLILNVTSLLFVIIAGALSDFFGRRPASFLFCVVGFMGFLYLHMTLDHNPSTFDLSTTELMLPFALCCMGFGINGVMGIFAPELFPTYLRSTSPGISQNLGKGLGGMLGPPIAGILVINYGFPWVLGLPGWLFLGIALLVYTLPEVGGKSL